MKHVPVMPNEVLQYLAPRPGAIIVDATFGAGGHTEQILKMLGPTGKLIGIDRDSAAIDAATSAFASDVKAGRLVLVQARFSELANVLEELGQAQVDGILMDLGVSTQQMLSPTRGFSFSHTAPLDMRMDTREDFTAARLLTEWSEHQLRELFWSVGERRYAGRLARAIVRRRADTPIETTTQLTDLVTSVLLERERSRRKTNVATRVFLGLRIAVNHELREIEDGLNATIHALRPGGRLVVISFQSLEDALVKHTFRTWASPCVCPPEQPICTCRREPLGRILTKKPVVVSEKEVIGNPRARSAKLRACERL